MGCRGGGNVPVLTAICSPRSKAEAAAIEKELLEDYRFGRQQLIEIWGHACAMAVTKVSGQRGWGPPCPALLPGCCMEEEEEEAEAEAAAGLWPFWGARCGIKGSFVPPRPPGSAFPSEASAPCSAPPFSMGRGVA